MVQLTDDLVELLDAEAARQGVSRSALIRDAVTAYLVEAREAALTRELVAGYTRVPAAALDDWGDLDRQRFEASLATMRRLGAEERSAGLEPW